MQELRDTQNERDDRNLPINRVGVKSLRFPVEVREKNGEAQRTIATVALAVDLPHHYQGTHMSRFVEVLNSHGKCLDVRSMAALPRELLERLEARRAHVEFEFPFFRRKAAPVTGKEGMMDYDVRFSVEAEKDGEIDAALADLDVILMRKDPPLNSEYVYATYLLELAEKVIGLTNSKSEIIFEPLPTDDPVQRQPDISRARDKLKWESVTPLEEGLRKTIDYFENFLRKDEIL